MYSVSVRCNKQKQCSGRARIGPPDHNCLVTEKSPKKDEGKTQTTKENANFSEFEFADDAISLDKKYLNSCFTNPNSGVVIKDECIPYTTVTGKEELPCIHKYYLKHTLPVKDIETMTNNSDNFQLMYIDKCMVNKDKINKNLNGNPIMKEVYGYCTLPKYRKKKICNSKDILKYMNLPKRITPDGTHIYYWCDVKKTNTPVSVIHSSQF